MRGIVLYIYRWADGPHLAGRQVTMYTSASCQLMPFVSVIGGIQAATEFIV